MEGSGLEVTVDQEDSFKYITQLKPNWQPTEVLYTRLHLDLTDLTMVEGDRFGLVRQIYDNRQGDETPQAEIRIRHQAGQIEIQLFGPANRARLSLGNGATGSTFYGRNVSRSAQ